MPGRVRAAGLLILAIIFSLGLTFASIELPRLVDKKIQLPHPAVDSHAGVDQRFRTELFIKHYHLRTIGYACFGAILLMIIAGFASRKRCLASLGAVAIFLPVFGQFALTMFYLAGLGLLNVGWLPFLDVSLDTMTLGEVIHLPLRLLNRLGSMIGVNLQTPFSVLLIAVGLLLFILGVYAWLTARYRKQGVADFWLYRFSRHPQYLGWILWSYGMLICPINLPNMKRSWGIEGSLAWLLSTMIIIGVCLLEEIQMKRDYGKTYQAFRERTPFLFPLPKWIGRSLSWPGRALFGEDFPKRRREVALIIVLYTAVLIGLSYPAKTLRPRFTRDIVSDQLAEKYTDAELVQQAAESHPRYRDRYFQAIRRHEKTARETFTGMLRHPHGALREGGIHYLMRMPDPPEAEFIRLLDDPESGVQWAAIAALGEMGSVQAADGIIRILEQGDHRLTAPCVGALGNMKTPKARDTLLKLRDHENYWVRTVLAGALANYPDPECREAIVSLLGDEHDWVRRSAALALLKLEDPSTRSVLKKALDDPDWEVRLYAKEALARLNQ